MDINRSRAMQFMECNRKYHYSYNLGLDLKKQKIPLLVGTAVHKFLETWYNTQDRSTDERLKESKAILVDAINQHVDKGNPLEVEMMSGVLQDTTELCTQYVQTYGTKDNVTVIEPEVFGRAPLLNNHWLIFLTDAVIRYNGSLWLMENKTTSRMGPGFIESFSLDHQPICYVYGARKITGLPIKGVLLNVMRKKSKYTSIAFQRETILITAHQIGNTVKTLSRIASDIESRDPTSDYDWPQNTNACSNWGRCQFWDICAYGAEAIEGPLYQHRDQSPTEARHGTATSRPNAA